MDGTYTVGVRDVRGIEVLFYNGVNNSMEGAKRVAGLISTCFNGQRITGFHNPTHLTQVLGQSVDERVAERFSSVISTMCSKLEDKYPLDQHTIAIFCHSHGACVTYNALKTLPEQTRQIIRVYAFAGAILIPRSIALSVFNTIYECDFIAIGGSVSLQCDRLPKLTTLFYRIQKATQKEAELESALNDDQALRRIFAEHHFHLIPNPDQLEEAEGLWGAFMHVAQSLIHHKMDYHQLHMKRLAIQLGHDLRRQLPLTDRVSLRDPEGAYHLRNLTE